MNIQIWNKMQHYHNLIENADVSNYLKRKSGVCDVTNVHILPEEEVYIEDEDEVDVKECDHVHNYMRSWMEIILVTIDRVIFFGGFELLKNILITS